MTTGSGNGTAFELRGVTKRFRKTVALDRVDVTVPSGGVVGLIGRNGSGKTTLLRHVLGLYLPTEGTCTTLGVPADRLDDAELARIGAVHQTEVLIAWMRVEQHLRYVASFFPRWDRELEGRLVRDLDLDRRDRVGTLSPGNAQKLALILAFCHHPDLVLLDEPLSALDPIARAETLRFLFEVMCDDGPTLVISSHVLHDVERLVDRIVCLDRGQVTEQAPLDTILERWAEWVVTAGDRPLPARFEEPWVVEQRRVERQAVLLVRDAGPELAGFRRRYGAVVEARRVMLDRLFPYLAKMR